MSSKKAYVIGDNVKVSLSPLIFKYWLNKYNIDGDYGYIEIPKDSFSKKIKKIFHEKELCGLNITTPFKEKIIPHLNKIDKHSKSIGAVNCVTKKNNELVGTNTDWIGFKKSIERANLNFKEKTAIVIGFGGASKAIVYSLILKKCKKIKIFNRNFNKFEQINKNHTTWGLKAQKIKDLGIQTYKLDDLEQHTNTADIIINTTPTNVLKSTIDYNIRQQTIGFDVVYRPKKGTGFLNRFEKNNRVGGIYMLVYQAVPCFNKWFGLKPEIDTKLFDILYKKMEEDQ